MQSGKLRHKVTLARRVDTQATSGQAVHTYEDFASVRARIRPLSGREFVAAQQIQADITTEITIRFRKDVDETCIVKHTTSYVPSPPDVDVYDIVAVMPDEKTSRRELRFMCTKRSADGWRNPK